MGKGDKKTLRGKIFKGSVRQDTAASSEEKGGDQVCRQKTLTDRVRREIPACVLAREPAP